jgi:dTDP-4-dehydrorhamnose 3,5-epimerase
MKLTPLRINGAWLSESPIWRDERGAFREWFKRNEIFEITGIDFQVGQANVSLSNKGVIRGIHYSLAPEGQAKWVTCVTGAILDVIIDIRPTSPTYGQVEYVDLRGGEGRAVLVGVGLGHGFISLEDQTSVTYLLSSPYAPEFELEIQPTDPAMKIDWHLELIGGVGIVLSPKDAKAPTLEQRKLEGKLP